jgi:hypothetical protein
MMLLSSVLSVERFGHRVVIAIAAATDAGGDAGVSEPVTERVARVLGGFNWSSQHRRR